MSAGNGAAMRAAIVGVFFHDRPEERLAFGRALAQVTHRDQRAVEGALFVADLAACLANDSGDGCCERSVAEARCVVMHAELGAALDRAIELAAEGVSTSEAARVCGTTGFVLHTVPFAMFCMLRYARSHCTHSPRRSPRGATLTDRRDPGGLAGCALWPERVTHSLIARIHDGPFGPEHLRELASCLGRVRDGIECPVPRYSATAALLRNLGLYPVILAHGVRRLAPFRAGPAVL